MTDVPGGLINSAAVGVAYEAPGDGPEVDPEPPAAKTSTGPFDPADHTVPDVEAYVAAHPDELDRIVAAELAGKNRSTLLDALGA